MWISGGNWPWNHHFSWRNPAKHGTLPRQSPLVESSHPVVAWQTGESPDVDEDFVATDDFPIWMDNNGYTLHIHTYHTIPYHCIPYHCITLHYIALHCIALHYITLHCITLHYITYIRTNVHTYVHPFIHTYIHKYMYIICVCISIYIYIHIFGRSKNGYIDT